MRKIVVSELLSLDGVAEDPDKFLTDWDDDVMDANMSAVIDTQDAVILGRRSYDEWARFWPESTIEPYATFINAVAKFVVTSTPLDREWANARVVEGGLIEFVRELQDQPGGDIGVHASISVAQALLAAGVVDELKLVIAPTIAGAGRRLLDGLPAPAARIDPKRDVANWETARGLPHHSLADGRAATGTHEGSLRTPKPCTACAEPALPDDAAFCFRCGAVVGESAADRFFATALWCGDDARARGATMARGQGRRA
jgi:dihydrofolate reductase